MITVSTGSSINRRGTVIGADNRVSTLPSRKDRPAPKKALFNWIQEILTLNSDGLTDTYYLSKKPTYNLTVTIYINGVLQVQGLHYQINEKQITFNDNIPAGYNIVARYNAISLIR